MAAARRSDAFSAHTPDRDDENLIASQQIFQGAHGNTEKGEAKARNKRGENEEENERETARRRVSSARNGYRCNVRRGERGALAYSARSRRAQLPQQRGLRGLRIRGYALDEIAGA